MLNSEACVFASCAKLPPLCPKRGMAGPRPCGGSVMERWIGAQQFLLHPGRPHSVPSQDAGPFLPAWPSTWPVLRNTYSPALFCELEIICSHLLDALQIRTQDKTATLMSKLSPMTREAAGWSFGAF